ncbi:MAG: hypothetical protein H0X17_02010 [Deltaproteobacteria bacterium]|nr:hypothetical protein [Deltaproteobacteria bacterium]
MSRWLLLLLVPACNSTFTPELPAALPYATRALSLANTHTLIATELPPNSIANVQFAGTEVPRPYDEASGEPLALDLPAASDVVVGRAHACVVSPTGSVHCWGDQTYGALGAHRACLPPVAEGGLPDCVLGALIMPSLPPTRALAAGDDFTCATLLDDRVVCWGETGAKLGGSVLPSLDPPTPVKLPGGASLAADRVVISHGTVCAIDLDARLWCWGDRFGATPQLQPQTGVVDIAIGRRHSCIIDAGGLACWGDNRNGQVGDATGARRCPVDEDVPCVHVDPRALELDAVRVVVGERHTCALRRDGAVACWGSNEVGQLGRDDAFLVGDLGFVLEGAADLASGYAHTCALRADGSAYCWGATSVLDPSLVK